MLVRNVLIGQEFLPGFDKVDQLKAFLKELNVLEDVDQ